MVINVEEMYFVFIFFIVSLQKNEVSQTGIGTYILNSIIIMQKKFFSLFVDPLTVKKDHHDFDDDSGIGSSTFKDTNSITLSEVSCYFTLLHIALLGAMVAILVSASYLALFY